MNRNFIFIIFVIFLIFTLSIYELYKHVSTCKYAEHLSYMPPNPDDPCGLLWEKKINRCWTGNKGKLCRYYRKKYANECEKN